MNEDRALLMGGQPTAGLRQAYSPQDRAYGKRLCAP